MTFTGESTRGSQGATGATPVAPVAGIYTVSKRAPGCRISTTALFFVKKSTDGTLAAAASNGRYDYGTDDVMNSSATS